MGFSTSTAETVVLRDVTDADLPFFFAHQQDPAAIRMAAFTAKDPSDWEAFRDHWARIRSDDTTDNRAILFEGQVVGHVSKYETLGEPEITYWIGHDYWGRGLATQALSEFLHVLKTRPLYARVVHDNVASRRVLEKCGFVICGTDQGFANGRGAEVDEFILRLDAEPA